MASSYSQHSMQCRATIKEDLNNQCHTASLADCCRVAFWSPVRQRPANWPKVHPRYGYCI